MDEKTLNTIEFPKVLEQVAQQASFEVGKELVLALQPETDIETIRRRQAMTTEAVDALEIKSDLSVGGARDIRGIIRRAQMGGAIDPNEFLDVASTLEWAQRIKGFILRAAGAANEFPLLAFQAKRIFNSDKIETDIKRCINDSGEIVDDASPSLRQIRHDVRVAHSTLLDRLQAILASSQSKAFQEHVITMRNGRYVLPVKADFKGQIKGIVHDQSSSGVTLFIEPMATVELNNRWRQLQLAEEKEILRILQDLATLLAAYADEIWELVSALGQIDLALAKGRYSRLKNCVEPRILSGEAGEDVLEFIDARHPLLTGAVVPITVRLGGDYHTLVVTGPNTGGKTVGLKTAGLLTVMAQSGLHVPANSGRLPVFHHVFADIGDEQSIEQSLSTFSSHISHIINMLKQVDNRSLVLLDEIGAGTDPAEGAALARSILAYLAKRGAYTIATTHYSDLKSYAYATPGVENASVEFDPETLAPKYRLIIGIPGRSNAITIAARLGLNQEIINSARDLLDPTEVKIDDLLGQIQEERREAERQRQDAERAAAEARKLARNAEKRLHEIELEKNDVLEQVREEALDRISELQERLAALERDAENVAVTRQWLSQSREEGRKVAKEVQRVLPRKPRPQPVQQQARKLQAGDSVKVQNFDMAGEVLAIVDDGKFADVQVGAFKMRLPVDELQYVKRERERKQRQVTLNVAPAPVPSIECDLRGKRAEEIEPILDRYLNDAYLAGMQNIRIIHGKGTGVLRQVVRDILSAHPLVASYETAPRESGGEGATEAALVSRMEVASRGRENR